MPTWPFEVQYLQREGGWERRFLRESFFVPPTPPTVFHSTLGDFFFWPFNEANLNPPLVLGKGCDAVVCFSVLHFAMWFSNDHRLFCDFRLALFAFTTKRLR